ncbi:Cellulase-8, endo-1,4-beta-glucanase [Globisporangium polare]
MDPPTLQARSDGVYLDDARFVIKGASYFGMESDILVPHGLWGGDASTTLAQVAELLVAHEFNVVRVPLAVRAVLENTPVDKYKMGNEKELVAACNELRYLDVLDYVVRVFAEHRLLVLLDAHVLEPGGPITPLWYDNPNNRDWFQQAWSVLASRYASCWNAIGADLKNEPHGDATWGSGDLATDWRLAATNLSEHILSICPRWLIFVEGIQSFSHGGHELPCFWGENLCGVKEFPMELSVPNRLVYSPHVYGPDVADQPYFHDSQFPKNMASVWDAHFGFVRTEGIGPPLIIGEWGGKYRSEADRKWQNEFAEYLRARAIDAIYWCVNPNSGDTEGLLENDWRTPNADKLRLLSVFRGSSVPVPSAS